eukprot:COSAG02_NODE_15874_length_1134_cov_1.401932_1_plen_57_part_01
MLEDAQIIRWRMKLLARARGVGITARTNPRLSGDGVDIEVGPFVLRRSGQAGQSMQQ